MAKKMHPLCWIGFILLIVGGLNWGLVGLFSLTWLQPSLRVVGSARIIYILVGLSAIGVLMKSSGAAHFVKSKQRVKKPNRGIGP